MTLRAVPSPDTIPEDGPQTMGAALAKIDHLEDIAQGLERKIRGLILENAGLRREAEVAARNSPLWDEAEALFGVWKRATGRTRCRFSVERFQLVEGFLHADGYETCARAVVGRVFDHFENTRKNGTTVHYHEWERIFGGQANATKPHRGAFEESANRAPSDWRQRLEGWSK